MGHSDQTNKTLTIIKSEKHSCIYTNKSCTLL